MKKLIIIVFVIIIFSCGNEKIILLPEISHTEITEIFDVSPAYLFYDETKPDSLELNRKTLISTTNWLVNVDKRLTLKQAIPKIIFLQNKKRNAELHKNENAKNYYTCNDTSRKNLGFIEFTDVFYKQEPITDSLKHKYATLHYSKNKFLFNNKKVVFGVLADSLNKLKDKILPVILKFDKSMIFQEYISAKEQLLQINNPNIIIDANEYIY